jgi:aldose 1-epimerase
MTAESRRIERAEFGRLPTGEMVEAYTLRNARGMEMRVATYGAIILSLRVADRDGRFDDIVLGHDSLDGYARASPYFGAIVGRFANRIARGRFTLDGIEYRLATNDGPNHLHGGLRGFDKVVWSASTKDEAAGPASMDLRWRSAAGDEGYPGALDVRVRYVLDDDNAVTTEYEATTDQPTVLNLTQHSYFNLTGGRRDVIGHELAIDADGFTPVDGTLIPTGEIARVVDTALDFRQPTPIGARIATDDEQLLRGGGYDHNFVLRPGNDALARAARVREPESGRTLEVWTTEPGIQFYSGNFLDGSIVGKHGVTYRHRWGFCLEAQHFPDSPNQPAFPPVVLRPGEHFRSRTVWRFGVDGM